MFNKQATPGLFFLIILSILFVLSVSAFGKYSGGEGTAEEPYRIATPNDLNEIRTNRNDWDDHFVMVNDINLAERPDLEFEPIGGAHSGPFNGVFDGNGHTIANFTCISSRQKSVGLFGYIYNMTAEIKNLGLIYPNVQAINASFVGSLVGETAYGNIRNCWAEGVRVSGGGSVGGLCGNCWSGSASTPIENCYASGIVEGGAAVGGLIGSNGGVVLNCYSAGQVIGTRMFIGGLAGSNTEVISECFSTCNVWGDYCVGGLIGYSYNSYSGGGYDSGINITNCYATGTVSGNDRVAGLVGKVSECKVDCCYSIGEASGIINVGGLIGSVTDGKVVNSFWDIQTSKQPDSAGGQGKTTEQLQTYNTFIVWGCAPVWTIDDGNDYPHLLWENEPGVLITTTNYGGGDGTEENPYLIYTAEQLNAIGLFECDWDKHFKLMADIDLSDYNGTEFNLIGYDDGLEEIPFTGVFDGDGHTISNFSYQSSDAGKVGLFGYVGGWFTDHPKIKNLVLIDPNIDAGSGGCVGALVGYLKYGSVIDSRVEGGSIKGNGAVGGLVGSFLAFAPYGHQISGCYTDVNVSGSGSAGGLVGNNYKGTITDCCSVGNVWGSGDCIGGLVGYNHNGATISGSYADGDVVGVNKVGGLVGSDFIATITGCYATGSVEGTGSQVGGLVGCHKAELISNSYATGNVFGIGNVGGLVGVNDGHVDTSTISNCYATGSVTGGENVGGLVGHNFRGDVSNSYAAGLVTGNADLGGLIGDSYSDKVEHSFWDVNTTEQLDSDGGQGKTTSEMRTAMTFIAWRCEEVWNINEGLDYPRLIWENKPGIALSDIQVYGGGSGTEEDPYLIYTPEQLSLVGVVACEADKYYQLRVDINLADYTYTEAVICPSPGYGSNFEGLLFDGTFDGNGHSISHLTIDATQAEGSYLGLFGAIGYQARVQNLIIEDVNIMGAWISWGIGGLSGSNRGTITDCSVSGIISTGEGSSCIGGLVGFSEGWEHEEGDYSYGIANCYTRVNIHTDERCEYIGGLVGINCSKLANCYAEGNITAGVDSHYIGGLIGYNIGEYGLQAGHISNSYASVNITSGEYGQYLGGLVGLNSTFGVITECKATGSVSGGDNTQFVGGLAGYNEGGFFNSYASGSVEGFSNVGGLAGSNDGGYPDNGTIFNCYSEAITSGLLNTGAITGEDTDGSYSACFWDSNVNPDVNGIGNTTDPNVIGKTTAEMQMESTFTDAGWDFVGEVVNGANDVWTINEEVDYPKLVWPLVNFVGWYEVDFADWAVFSSRWFDSCPVEFAGSDITKDGIVDIKDFCLFAGYWFENNCGSCGGADITGDGEVNYDDLSEFVLSWLMTDFDCQGADLDFSGLVDLADLQIFCNYWLEGAGG